MGNNSSKNPSTRRSKMIQSAPGSFVGVQRAAARARNLGLHLGEVREQTNDTMLSPGYWQQRGRSLSHRSSEEVDINTDYPYPVRNDEKLNDVANETKLPVEENDVMMEYGPSETPVAKTPLEATSAVFHSQPKTKKDNKRAAQSATNNLRSSHPADIEDYLDPFYDEPLISPGALSVDSKAYRLSVATTTASDPNAFRRTLSGMSTMSGTTASPTVSRGQISTLGGYYSAEQSFISTCSNIYPAAFSDYAAEEVNVWIDERRYQNSPNAPYPMPNDEPECKRLEQLHVLIRGVLKQNYIAPLDEPKQVLDIGCGTGIWMLEMAEEFPECEFTGIDISNILRTETLPANCTFKLGNALERLRFKDGSFDYVHQLQFGLGVPKRHWPRLCREYKRILRSDGWMEFAETDGRYFRTGPAGNQINNWLKDMYAAQGVEPRRCCLLPEILADAGFPVVLRRIYSFPLGQWGKRLGQAALVDAQLTLQSLWPRIREVETQLTKEEFDRTVQEDWPAEVDDHKTYFNLRVYWCQKD